MGPYVDPIGSGLNPARIDMGVDYTGSGTLYALGAGTITNVSNSGWPGGKFITLHLTEGPYAGKFVYYAENIISKVHVGQKVSAGTPIGTAVGTYPFIEVGWAASPGTGQTMAASAGQQSKSGDPGAVSSAYGKSMSDLIKSLGGPAGIQATAISGSVPAAFSVSGGTPTANANTTASLLPGCVPLIGWVYLAAHYFIGGTVERNATDRPRQRGNTSRIRRGRRNPDRKQRSQHRILRRR